MSRILSIFLTFESFLHKLLASLISGVSLLSSLQFRPGKPVHLRFDGGCSSLLSSLQFRPGKPVHLRFDGGCSSSFCFVYEDDDDKEEEEETERVENVEDEVRMKMDADHSKPNTKPHRVRVVGKRVYDFLNGKTSHQCCRKNHGFCSRP